MPDLDRQEHETARIAAIELNEGRGQEAANTLRGEFMRLSQLPDGYGQFMKVVAETQRMENHAPGLPQLTVTNAVDAYGRVQTDAYGRPMTDVSVSMPGVDAYNRPVMYKDDIAMVPPPPVPVPVEAPPPAAYGDPVVMTNPWLSIGIGINIGRPPVSVERPRVIVEPEHHDHDRDRDRHDRR